MEEKLPLKFGFVLSTDEEVGSESLHAFLNSHPQLKADIVLDVDVAGDITKIITKCKNPVIVKLIANNDFDFFRRFCFDNFKICGKIDCR